MKLFFDTSTLIKRYIEEKKSNEVLNLFNMTDEVIISPITKIEFISAIQRRLNDNSITRDDYKTVMDELDYDIQFFSVMKFNDEIEEKSIEIIKKYGMKTLDSIQLSSALLSQTDKFITSDVKLFSISEKEFKNISVLL